MMATTKPRPFGRALRSVLETATKRKAFTIRDLAGDTRSPLAHAVRRAVYRLSRLGWLDYSPKTHSYSLKPGHVESAAVVLLSHWGRDG